jgi:tRNA G46 methylase TrmB
MGESFAEDYPENSSSGLFAELPAAEWDDVAPMTEPDDDLGECDGDRIRGRDVDCDVEAAAVDPDASVRYDRRKPKWWKRRVGRYVTKPQRRAVEAMKEYRLEKPPHGQFLDFEAVFSGLPSETTATQDEDCNGVSPVSASSGRRRRVWMELGFGRGDNLLCLAGRDPGSGFVGAEVHPGSVATCLQRMQASMERRELWIDHELYDKTTDPFFVERDRNQAERASSEPQNPSPTVGDTSPARDGSSDRRVVDSRNRQQGAESESIPPSLLPYRNVRVYGGDGIVLLETCVAPASLDAVLITFPDPFPSDKPHRILQVHTVATIYRCLAPGGRLCLATDHPVFYEWSLRTVETWNSLQEERQTPSLSPAPCSIIQRLERISDFDRTGWLPVVSRYERKGWDEGRATLLACWGKSCVSPTPREEPADEVRSE